MDMPITELPLTGTDVYALPRDEGEWVPRRPLAAAYRLVDPFGWTEPISMVATAFHGKLSNHDYEGPSLDLDERGRLLKNLGDNQAMMLRNHGLLVTGRSVPEAFLRLYRLERACQIQIDAAAAGALNV